VSKILLAKRLPTRKTPAMKRLLLSLACFSLGTMVARADLVVVQKMDSAMMKGDITMKMKGDQARIESTGGPIATTVILDLKSNVMATLIPAQKMMMKANLADLKKMGEAQMKSQGVDLTTLKPKDTGTKEKVGEWDCEIYELSMGPNMTVKMWISKDYPNAKAISEQMKKLSAAMSSNPAMAEINLDGVALKTEMTMGPGGKMTTSVVSIKEEPVADSEFALPTDYKEIPMPGVK
jgi:hypothetical protein